jgi:H+-transporting ATPase
MVKHGEGVQIAMEEGKFNSPAPSSPGPGASPVPKRRPSGIINLTKRTSSDVILIQDGKKFSDIDVMNMRDEIEMDRRMTDADIRNNMHSARPKAHETRAPGEKPKEEVKKEVKLSEGLTTAQADELRKTWGLNELEEKTKSKMRILYEQFFMPMPCMIWAAIVIEIILGNWVDVVVLFLLQNLNGFVGFYETVKAGNAVAALKASLKPVAHVKRDGKWNSIESSLLVPGDLVMLGSGSAVPADCMVHGGQIDVDQSALTGESLPVTMGAGDEPKMGSTVTRGEVEATVMTTGMNTFFGKTASLIQSVDGMSKLDRVLLGVVIVLLSISMVGCIIMLIYLLVNGENVKDSLSFVVVLLVASIPVAMEVVVVSTMALGARKLAEMQAIVANLPAIEQLAGMNMLCSDKTGTLTMNKMVIQQDCPMFIEDLEREDVILHAALAAKWKEPPKDALDTMVLGAADLAECDNYEQLDYLPFDPTIKRTEATLKPLDGSTGPFKVTKGAPHIVLDLCHDKELIEQAVDLKVIELAERGIRSLAVARTDEEGHWHMMGILTFLDPPRVDTKVTIMRAMEFGVDVKMITGDHTVIAKETARQLGMGTNILGAEGLPSLNEDGSMPKNLGETLGKKALGVNGFAQVFPEHKFLIVEALRQLGCSVGMTGDGVNDAPALKKADVGIAVQGATDAARASADIILTAPGLSVVIEAIIISRQIFTRVKNFVIYRVACTLQLLFFFFIAVSDACVAQ